ncbi:MAG: glycosyltransferase [Elusimicrobiales bacterium]|nr:glycosyltransferase [Elusimicrobiales bacterium]
MKRILLVIENSSYGGGERSFAALALGLSARGVEVHAACGPGEAFRDGIAGSVRVHELPLNRLFDPGALLRLRSVIRSVGPDVVHSQGARADFYAALACRLAGVEHVSTVAMPVEGFDVGPVRRAVYRYFGALGERLTSRFIVVSEDLRERLIRGHGVAREKIFVIPNCAWNEFFARAGRDEALAAELGLSGCLVAGAAGRLVWQKGFDVLLEAFASLRGRMEKGRPVKLLMIGDGPLRETLCAKSAALGLGDSVVWTGFRNDMARIMSLCDLFVLPSLREGQPIALIEAMALGLPIAASDLPGVKETAADATEALLSGPGDAAALGENIARIISDRSLAGRLGAGARARAEKDFSEGAFIAKHAAFYGMG